MARELYLKVGEPALSVRSTEGTDTVNDERVVGNGRVEALSAVPGHAAMRMDQCDIYKMVWCDLLLEDDSGSRM